ncbi:hypothetical protein VQ643_11640 [Pseudomonas sp. F1_0610]|uniref:DUF6882 domain-containing protein n=1 Tax=Pseudomonas sp. F1_0610 TaxID=3114284 RepID=UPI0039C173D5
MDKLNTLIYTTEQELIERFAVSGYDKQYNLSEVIGDRDWRVDLDTQKLYFAEDICFDIQVLGTFSHATSTWLWSWANTQWELPPALLEQALALKNFGEEHDIPIFTQDMQEIEQQQVHLLGMLSSGMLSNSCYYAADYGDGILLMTINDKSIDDADSDDCARISSVFSQTISLFEMNHRKAFAHYLRDKGFKVWKNTLATKNNLSIQAEFDEFDRLTSLRVG